MKKISIALDGPAGAGKSTIAKKIAEIKNLIYIDTGAMYRAITLKSIQEGILMDDHSQIHKLLDNTIIELKGSHIFLDGKDVTKDIRSPEVNKQVSNIAKVSDIRTKMVELQRSMASNNNVIMDGRDIGTNVLPNATYKFFLTASLDERAKRRYEELLSKGYSTSIEEVIVEMQIRDKVDSEREINPLKKADDAIIIDTTNKIIEQVITEILSYIK